MYEFKQIFLANLHDNFVKEIICTTKKENNIFLSKSQNNIVQRNIH